MEIKDLTKVNLRELIREQQQESSSSDIGPFSSKKILGEYSFNMRVILAEESSVLNQIIKLRMEEMIVSETQKVIYINNYRYTN